MITNDAHFVGIGKASNDDKDQPCSFITAVYKPKNSKCYISWVYEGPVNS